MIPDDRITKALTEIANMVDDIGRLLGRMRGLEHRLKICKSMGFLEADGTVAEREARALVSQEYRDMVAEQEAVTTELETLRTRFKLEELVIEVWRTQQASSRKGHV